MDEATTDKENSSTSESELSKQKNQGWMRLHVDEKTKPPPTNEPLGEETQSGDRKITKERSNPVE